MDDTCGALPNDTAVPNNRTNRTSQKYTSSRNHRQQQPATAQAAATPPSKAVVAAEAAKARDQAEAEADGMPEERHRRHQHGRRGGNRHNRRRQYHNNNSGAAAASTSDSNNGPLPSVTNTRWQWGLLLLPPMSSICGVIAATHRYTRVLWFYLDVDVVTADNNNIIHSIIIIIIIMTIIKITTASIRLFMLQQLLLLWRPLQMRRTHGISSTHLIAIDFDFLRQFVYFIQPISSATKCGGDLSLVIMIMIRIEFIAGRGACVAGESWFIINLFSIVLGVIVIYISVICHWF